MALTPQQNQRIIELEQRVKDIERIIKNVGSKSMLNQMKLLVDENLRKMRQELEAIEPQVEELLDKVDKLQ
jgi:archaellum component FlaC